MAWRITACHVHLWISSEAAAAEAAVQSNVIQLQFHPQNGKIAIIENGDDDDDV